MRADLMAQLRKVIKSKKLTQAKVADLLGVSQSRISDLVRGKWEKFSLEMLITLATRASLHVILKTTAERTLLPRRYGSALHNVLPSIARM